MATTHGFWVFLFMKPQKKRHFHSVFVACNNWYFSKCLFGGKWHTITCGAVIVRCRNRRGNNIIINLFMICWHFFLLAGVSAPVHQCLNFLFFTQTNTQTYTHTFSRMLVRSDKSLKYASSRCPQACELQIIIDDAITHKTRDCPRASASFRVRWSWQFINSFFAYRPAPGGSERDCFFLLLHSFSTRY